MPKRDALYYNDDSLNKGLFSAYLLLFHLPKTSRIEKSVSNLCFSVNGLK